MDNYYNLAHSLEENRAMIGSFKLEKSAKLWWKDHCRENNLETTKISWEYLQTQLQRNYQNHTYRIEQLNKFLDCSQGKDNLETKIFEATQVCATRYDARSESGSFCIKIKVTPQHSSTSIAVDDFC